jgi:hypothetical protein
MRIVGDSISTRGASALNVGLAEALEELHELLARAVELDGRHGVLSRPIDGTVAGSTAATTADYVRARDLVIELLSGLPLMTDDERHRLALNADLPQLAFHLRIELEHAATMRTLDVERLARSLTFLKRHLVRLEDEFVHRRHESMSTIDRELVDGLARLTRWKFQQRYAALYDAAAPRRPFVDKLHRDYAVTGYPDGLLLALADLARRDDVDVVVCALRGALAISVLLDLLGMPSDRLAHVRCGRATSSQYDRGPHVFEPLDFDPAQLRDRRVVIVDNNVATGSTLTNLVNTLASYEPGRIGFFCDYILTDLGGLDTRSLRQLADVELDPLLVGPFVVPPDRRDEASMLKESLVRGTRSRLAISKLDPANTAEEWAS